ncbi:MAG: hypothetical protein DDT42_00726 [candidate division WS2 bacterium]|uniref:R3H domain-containing protein n=1 Tax=Psychracetigena formicireducens TaxID=2986056 RepID=A0A9E2F603_PSYF1|nr:hypothetical protein [Candidatus Psychracetigena formicireducens]MBT9144870.1 hypothetical protein [Candidatus Psychracetigena formicireducens]
MNKGYIEKEGASPREAFLKALLEMGALEEEVEHTIEEVLYKGFFGTTKKAYRCRLWLKSSSSTPKPTPAKRSELPVSGETRIKTEAAAQSNLTREILDRLGFEYESIREIKVDDGWEIDIRCEDPGKLIGKDGHTLFALQRLLSTLFFRQYGKGSIYLDINDYLKKREKRIEEQAIIAISKVKKFKKKIELKPMNNWERKIVHRKANEAGIISLSTGNEPYRRVVLSLENDSQTR